MQVRDETLIRVHRQWNSGQAGDVCFGDLQDFHWYQPTGAPRPLAHAFISCQDIVSGEIPHDCARQSAPHQLHVCILKRHVLPYVYLEIARRADDGRPVSGRGIHPESSSPEPLRTA